MPLYEYACTECDARFERLVLAAAADEVSCPRCDSPQPRRLISVIAGMTNRAPQPTCGHGACAACS